MANFFSRLWLALSGVPGLRVRRLDFTGAIRQTVLLFDKVEKAVTLREKVLGTALLKARTLQIGLFTSVQTAKITKTITRRTVLEEE